LIVAAFTEGFTNVRAVEDSVMPPMLTDKAAFVRMGAGGASARATPMSVVVNKVATAVKVAMFPPCGVMIA
jgi:hypothetical protein